MKKALWLSFLVSLNVLGSPEQIDPSYTLLEGPAAQSIRNRLTILAAQTNLECRSKILKVKKEHFLRLMDLFPTLYQKRERDYVEYKFFTQENGREKYLTLKSYDGLKTLSSLTFLQEFPLSWGHCAVPE